jgi:hypothetical protein
VSFDLGLAGCRPLVTAGTKGVGAAVVKALSENGVSAELRRRFAPTIGEAHVERLSRG